MIKSVDIINSFGVFNSYSKPAGMQEFAAKNLIYGWNYSGKTTLSRLFAMLEAKELHPDFQYCKFTLNAGENPITEKNFHECKLSIRVFNSDFVRKNLFFDSGSCNAILLIGNHSHEAQKKIDKKSKRINECEKFIQKNNKMIELFDKSIQEEKKLSSQKIRHTLGIDPYIATHLTNDIQQIRNSGQSHLLTEESLRDAVELANTPESKKPLVVNELNRHPSIETIHREAHKVLAAVPSFSNTIKHLEENPAIERWIENGLKLHFESGNCEFCGNPVTQHRLDALHTHFSRDVIDHKAKIQDLLDRVNSSEFNLDIPKTTELNPQFHKDYQDACEPLAGRIIDFNNSVKTLSREVAARLNNLYRPVLINPIPEGQEAAIVETMQAINHVIKQNNELAANFATAKATSRIRAKLHFVQESAMRLEEKGWERKSIKLNKRIKAIRAFSYRLQVEVDFLQSEISQAQQGREKINERLASMLGSEAIQIRVTNDAAGHERFQLVRKNGDIAKNLSDGERTAIAFSYFLTKLKELKSEDFKETIVYIDDPISSLDSAHIYQVTAAINDFFFAKTNQVTNNKGSWNTTCKQIFISTHNFEFFDLMRELKPNSASAARLYLVERKSGELRIMQYAEVSFMLFFRISVSF